MCFPFFKAQGHDVGDSLCEEEGVEPARRLLAAGGEQAAAAERPRRRAGRSPPTPRCGALDGVDVPDGWMGLDVGAAHRARATRR